MGEGAEAGRSVYLQSWRRAATQQSWQEISQTGVRGLGAGPSRAAPRDRVQQACPKRWERPVPISSRLGRLRPTSLRP